MVDVQLVHIEGEAREAVCENQELRRQIGQGEKDEEASAPPDAGAGHVDNVERETDGERGVESKIQGVEQILPGGGLVRGDLLQENAAHRGRRGEDIADKQQDEDKVLILQLA